MIRAVPEGASTLLRWCASKISTSYPELRMRAAMSSSLRVALTPTLMLGAKTMAIFWAATLISARPLLSKPVVPITIFTSCLRQACRCCSVPSGRVKSIRQSACARASSWSVMVTPQGRPNAAPASWPIEGEPARSSATASSTPSVSRTASISIWPMRPLAPAMAMRWGVACVIYLSGSKVWPGSPG
ncbi:Uncharacterised protein [Bordetella pertussis]|nr:Uncharacterised protein [Bordetella pertussis]